MSGNNLNDIFGSKIHVLIVDDEEWWLDFANKFLSKINPIYSFVGTTDPSKVIDILKQDSIDIIISDYLMSEMNGIDLLKQVKSIYPNMPFIMLTGKANKENFLLSLKHGVSYVISKNENVEYLFELLNYFILQAIKDAKFKLMYDWPFDHR